MNMKPFFVELKLEKDRSLQNQGVKEIPVGVESTIQTAVNNKTGETITSTDGGTTWKDAKGKIVK